MAVPSTRRQILLAISHLATAATLVSCSRSEDSPAVAGGNADLELLASVAYDILPYAGMPADAYVRAAQQILDLDDDDVPAGLQTLRDASNDVPWKDVAEARRVAILTSLQDSPFFSVVRTNTLQVLLRDPATFAIVGYGGSTIQHGGYLTRGFNDITWLPAPDNN